MNVLNYFKSTKKIAMYFNCNRTVIACDNKVVLDEPSVVAKLGAKNIAAGAEAVRMEESSSSNVCVTSPISDIVILDFSDMEYLVQTLFHKAFGSWSFKLYNFDVIIAMPTNYTIIEQCYLRDILFRLGAREVYGITSPLAVSIGMGVDALSSKSRLLVEVEPFTANITHLSSAKGIDNISIRVGGNQGVFYEPELSMKTIGDAIQSLFFEKTSELWNDFEDEGAYIYGEGAVLPGLDKYLSERFGLRFTIVNNSAPMIAMGSYEALCQEDSYPIVLMRVLTNKFKYYGVHL